MSNVRTHVGILFVELGMPEDQESIDPRPRVPGSCVATWSHRERLMERAVEQRTAIDRVEHASSGAPGDDDRSPDRHARGVAAPRGAAPLEKEHTRRGDDLAQMRRELPWVPVERRSTASTRMTAPRPAELFGDRSQLSSTTSCSDPATRPGARPARHRPTPSTPCYRTSMRGTTMLYVSRAPIERLLAYERMG